jgi:hypothetical protein
MPNAAEAPSVTNVFSRITHPSHLKFIPICLAQVIKALKGDSSEAKINGQETEFNKTLKARLIRF